jgi:rhodanese-related sulfurtransferase
MRTHRTVHFIAPVTLGFIAAASFAVAQPSTSILAERCAKRTRRARRFPSRSPGRQGFRRIVTDRQTLVLDARPFMEYAVGHVPGAVKVAPKPGVPIPVHVPASGVKPDTDSGDVKKAKDDGRLPMVDHNNRIVVFGRDGAQARVVAEAIVNEAFHNVAFFGGPFATIKAAAR